MAVRQSGAAGLHVALGQRLLLLRPHQWTKNLFVIAPLFFSGRFDELSSVLNAIAAFLTFSLAASAVYALNDIADREEDARHPVKRTRPVASGAVGVREAYAIMVGCAVLAVVPGLVRELSPAFWAVIGCYVAINVTYSFWLRHYPLVDVTVIASGFVLRVLAGAWALPEEPSSWIILCTGLLALFLALGKRRADLLGEDRSRRSLEGYDLQFVDTSLGALGAATIAFYALFTVSDYSLEQFDSDTLYLTTFPVALGILRYLQILIVKGSRASPTEIALGDRPLWLIVGVWIASFAVLTYLAPG